MFYNLFDSHAPFQIDGNFGACAGMAEMLMQSNSGTIRILPALPSAWTAGHITGMKAVGDVTVDIAWNNGEATRVKLTNNKGQMMRVLYKNLKKAKLYINDIPTEMEVGADDTVSLSGANGTTYVFDFDGSYNPTGIASVKDADKTADSKAYNVGGQRVGENYKGVVIKNGKKTLRK